jgi:23S rRNA (cytosine1962-C5)-methyltransferase
MTAEQLDGLLQTALRARHDLFDDRHLAAFRLFNGFTEGWPGLAVDLYARTAVLYNYSDPAESGEAAVQVARDVLQEMVPWIQTLVLKTRHASDPGGKLGRIVSGTEPDRKVLENGVWYALELMLNQDASLYLDTRLLRTWVRQNLKDRRVLNAFAYTGSLGVAAMAAGARQVIQLDRSRNYLSVAKASYGLNGYPVRRQDFLTGDFFPLVARLKHLGERFDCILLDPPFFSASDKGTVDWAGDSRRLINKVRPLVEDGGWLAAVNNALYLSGQEYLRSLEALCADGYLKIEALIPVPPDLTGYPETCHGVPPVNPSPFNHPTKIALLKVRRKV